MSGICAVLHGGGKPAAATELAPVLDALGRRGPDGSHIVHEGPVALGHALLATTPEALVETQPFRHRQSGCAITADVRLDNRADLLARLGLTGQPSIIGDAELVLQAYLRWGTACLDHLRGDFAFAIWDPREARLFCARDQVGMRQLIYHHTPGKLFALATEPLALLRHDDVPRQINEARIADYLENLEASDLTSTFFRGLHRLPPAHALIVTADCLRIWRYWQLEPREPLSLAGDDEYAEAFLEVFREAVAARLRAPDPVGAMLSGGMDSGSVAAVAGDLLKQAGRPPLETFSAVDTDPDCVESRAIRAALRIEHIRPTCLGPAELEQMREDMERLTLAADEPFDANMTLLRLMYLAGHRAGHKVILDGGGGDMTLGATNMVMWHLRQGRVSRAWREARGLERFWGPEPGATENFVRSAGRILIPPALRAARRDVAARLRPQPETPTLLSPEFAARVDLPARRRANAEHIAPFNSDLPENRVRRLVHPYLVVGRERYDRVASALAIEPRDPFVDLRLLEFCTALPEEQFQDAGWPKVILRRATAGLLPDPVRWRLGKEHLGGLLNDELWRVSLRAGSRAAMANAMANLHPFVTEQTIDSAAAAAQNGSAWDSEVAGLLTLRYASDWLTNIDKKFL